MATETLDAWRDPDRALRIAVERWIASEAVSDQFIERPASFRMVWNYVRHIGPVAVWRKVSSRLGERTRNNKSAGVGVGRVLESPAAGLIHAGQRVIFFAPNHSLKWPRITVDMALAFPLSESQQAPVVPALPAALRELAGWSPHSGRALDVETVRRELAAMSSASESVATPSLAKSSTQNAEAGRELKAAAAPNGDRRTAVLFGLGNYAKTHIVPHARRHFHLAAIHELDPDQIESAQGLAPTLDTSPMPRAGETHDVWFIAGFHHTHADLAVQALNAGSYAIVEKPLVTTRPQLSAIEAAFQRSASSRLFACFQRRYSRMNDWARQDLGISDGDPVDMHCLVYEIPAPALHWYNWPNSGSRIISNGCHWLDQFLFLNGFQPVADCDIQRLRTNDFHVRVALRNGAQMTMSLTDAGSSRLGVRDVVELRASNVTVRMVDATDYQAENPSRVVRSRRLNPTHAYRRMYETICGQVIAGAQGDSIESLRSTALMLDLEEAMGASRNDRRQQPPSQPLAQTRVG